MIRQLFRNSSIFFFGSLLSKVVTTLAWILLAKILAPEKYGQFTLYFMSIQFVTFLADFGLNQYYLKKVEEQGRSSLFNKIIMVRSFTLLISILFLTVILFLLKIFSNSINLLFLLSLIPLSYLSITDGYFLEQKKGFRVSLKLSSVGGIFLIGYLFFADNLSLFSTSLILLIALVLTLFWIFPWNDLKFTKLTISEVTTILKHSSSYAFLTLTSFFYNRGDAFIISYLLG